VINGVTTLGSLENTSSVVLPWLGITADGERHGFEGVVDSRLASSNWDDLADAKSRSASAHGATSITGSVRVARVGVKSVGHDPAKGFTGVTTVASSISSVAIYDFLRRSSGDTSSSNQVGGFGFLGSGEGPARTTLGLILNGGSLSSSDPVDGSSRTLKVHGGGGSVDVFLGSDTEEDSEFFDGIVGEHRVTEGGAWAVQVGSGDLGTGGDEVLESRLADSFRMMRSVPEGTELLEGYLVGNVDRSNVVVASGQ